MIRPATLKYYNGAVAGKERFNPRGHFRHHSAHIARRLARRGKRIAVAWLVADTSRPLAKTEAIVGSGCAKRSPQAI